MDTVLMTSADLAGHMYANLDVHSLILNLAGKINVKRSAFSTMLYYKILVSSIHRNYKNLIKTVNSEY